MAISFWEMSYCKIIVITIVIIIHHHHHYHHHNHHRHNHHHHDDDHHHQSLFSPTCVTSDLGCIGAGAKARLPASLPPEVVLEIPCDDVDEVLEIPGDLEPVEPLKGLWDWEGEALPLIMAMRSATLDPPEGVP